MSKTNYTVSIDVEVIEKVREISRNEPKGFISFYIQEALKKLIEEKGGLNGIRQKEETRTDY